MTDTEVMDLYSNYLKGMYNRFQMPLDDQWPPVQVDDYVPLVMVPKDLRQPAMEATIFQKAKHTLQGEIEESISNDSIIELDQLFESVDDSVSSDVKSILIEGGPGMGKTVLVLTICKRWAKGVKAFHSFKAVILWSLKDPCILEFRSVDDLIYHDSEDIKKQVIMHMRKFSGKGFLIVLDGWDELPRELANKKQNFLLDLIKGKSLPLASVIITSRSIQTQKLLKASFFHKAIEIHGFSKCHVKLYIKKCFQSNPYMAEQLLVYLNERPDILSICYVPMHCAIVMYVFSRKQKFPSTLTDFYGFLAKNSLLRNVQLRNLESQEVNDLEDSNVFPKEVEELYYALCELAFRGIWASKYTYSRQEIAAICESSTRIIINIDSLGILQAVNVFRSAGLQSLFHFLHSTVQEYMAAQYLTRLPVAEQSSYVRKYLSYRSFTTVWQFYCGIAAPTGLLKKIGIESKFCEEVLEITEGDDSISNFHSFESDEGSSDEEYEYTSEEESVEEIVEEEIIEEEIIEDYVEEKDVLDSSSEILHGIKIQKLSEHVQEEEDISGDRVGSQGNKLEKLRAPSLVISGASIAKRFVVPPEGACKANRSRLLFILKCVHESQLNSLCVSIAQKCRGCLFFFRNSFSAIDANALGFVIAKAHVSSRYWQLGFIKCGITADHLVTLHHQLKSQLLKGKIGQMHICENELDIATIQQFVNMSSVLVFCQKLTLSETKLNDEQVELLCLCISELRCLETLDLSKNCIGDLGVIKLCEALKHAVDLTCINLSCNCISTSGAKSISHLATKSDKLTSLNLSSNSIGDEGLSSIAASIGDNCSIATLNVSSNSITEVGAAFLATSLSVNNILKDLTIHSNSIGNSGAEFIFSALVNNSSLSALDLSNCLITHDGSLAKAIERSLSHNISLETLKVANNCFTDDGISAILDAISSSATVAKLDIANNEIGTKVMQKLGSFLCDNNSLEILTISSLEVLADIDAFETFCDCLVVSNDTFRKLELLQCFEAGGIQEKLEEVNLARQNIGKKRIKLKFKE